MADNPDGDDFPDNYNAELLPEPDLGDDAENAFFLPPDHPLFASIQAKLKQSLMEEMQRASATIMELQVLQSQLKVRQEDEGVEMHGYQQQLAEAQTALDSFVQRHAETVAARQIITDQQKAASEELNRAQEELRQAEQREEDIRDAIAAAAQMVMETAVQNEELKSDALIRKRAVYRAEEQIQMEEKLKMEQEVLIEMHQSELKRLQDVELQLLKQYDVQRQETEQASVILEEALKQMEQIKSETTETRRQWQSVLKQIENRTMELKQNLELSIAELRSTQISLQQALRSGRKERERLLADISKVTDDTRRLQNKRTSLAEQRTVLKEEVITRLQQQYQTLNQSVQEQNNKLTQVQLEIAKETKVIEQISRENDKAQKALQELENEILIKNAAQAADNRQLQILRQEYKQTSIQIRDVQREIEKLQNEIQKRRYDQISCEGAVSTLQNAEQALSQEVKEKDELISSYEQQLRKNANAIEQRSSAITRLNKKLEEYQKAHPESDNGPLQTTLNNLGKELQQAAKTVKEVQAAWLRAQTDLVQLSQQFDAERAEIADKEEQKALLERKLKSLDYENQAANLKTKAVLRDIEFLHKDLQQLNSKQADLERQIQSLQESNFDQELGVQEQIDQKVAQIDAMRAQAQEYLLEKQDIAGSLVELEEQIMLWQRKTQIQQQLMESIKEHCSLGSNGVIAELEQQIHQFELSISNLKKRQQQLLQKMEQGIDMRLVHANTVRALQAVTKKPTAIQAGVKQELDGTQMKIEQSTQRLEKAKEQYVENSRKLQEALQENEELQGVIEQLRQRITGLE